MEIQPGPTGTYYLLKEGRRFGEAVFFQGYDRPMINYSTPPGLTPAEEEQVKNLPNPWKEEAP